MSSKDKAMRQLATSMQEHPVMEMERKKFSFAPVYANVLKIATRPPDTWDEFSRDEKIARLLADPTIESWAAYVRSIYKNDHKAELEMIRTLFPMNQSDTTLANEVAASLQAQAKEYLKKELHDAQSVGKMHLKYDPSVHLVSVRVDKGMKRGRSDD
uniref:Uncharacterized protein n=1 Tax=Hyaloperonospora arabidopsidis (strain Emoy2) TaxID=559515 RepID=M4C261_HYAAE